MTHLRAKQNEAYGVLDHGGMFVMVMVVKKEMVSVSTSNGIRCTT